MAASIESALRSKIPGVVLVHIKDVSDGCGAKLILVCVASGFDGVGPLDKNRMVHAAIEESMKEVHAITVNAWTPQQWEKRKDTPEVKALFT